MLIIIILTIIPNTLFIHVNTWITQYGESKCYQLLCAIVNPEFTKLLGNNIKIPIISIIERK